MICIHCEENFNELSAQKKSVGGKINECPDCLKSMDFEDTPKYLGVAAGNGKMSDITILSFEDNSQKDKYQKAWANNTGKNKGKSCQLGNHLTSMSGMKFTVVSENIANANHKGKL
jgi:hypothetical protein